VGFFIYTGIWGRGKRFSLFIKDCVGACGQIRIRFTDHAFLQI
jgi:hypothetical protein